MPTKSAASLPPVTSREENAKREIGVTAVTPALSWFLLVAFLLLIASVPTFEWARTRSSGDGSSAWAHLTELGGRVPTATAEARSSGAGGWWRRVLAANREVIASLTAFENALEDESHLGRLLRPPAQWVLSGSLGAGNERVYVGRDGWLFYRPDVEYVTTPPFLEPGSMKRRIGGASEWETPPQPDPRSAILQFKRDLEARGIALVVMPTPPKPGVHPERLSRGYEAAQSVLQNPSYGLFIEDLRREGTLVFDPSEALWAARRFDAQYLATDTHWRPEAMEEVANLLSSFITSHVKLPTIGDTGYQVNRVEVRNIGDTTRMLDLPEGTSLYPPESVWLRRVLQDDGSPWRSSRTADVLLLGDSFANIYTLESMGWGTSAGLAEQLSYALGRPVDRLVQNDDGAFATREMVARAPARLDGKRVVIYQFAARELAFGDWKILPLP